MLSNQISQSSPIYFAELSQAKELNPLIVKAYKRVKEQSLIRQTHHFHGRFENTYVDLENIPELKPICQKAIQHAQEITGIDNLKSGFWFNEMHSGDRTSLHNHDELDEVLSCVYYLNSPENSGRLVIREDYHDTFVEPESGLFVFFSPALEHEVEKNQSKETRLSIAFNFGPAE